MTRQLLRSPKIVKLLMSRTRRDRDSRPSTPGIQVLCPHILSTLFLIVTVFLKSSDAAKNELIVPENTGCACVGSVLTFTCTAVGRGSTMWNGTAFDCMENGNSILLRHDTFGSGSVTGECNNGAIVGRNVGVENECYTSQLSVTIDATLSNRSIRCIHNSFVTNTIGESTLTVVAGPYPQPNIVFLNGVSEGKLTFSWIFSVPRCATVSYNISSDCGSCPGRSNVTNATCSNLQLSSNPSNCSFSVRSVVCGIAGESNNPITVTLKVPNIPKVMITPVYSNDNQTLIKISSTIDQEPPFTVADGILSKINNFQIIYVSSMSDVTESVSKSSCGNVSSCEYTDDVPSTICQRQTEIYVIVSATNMFGEGPPSTPSMIGCTNQFVMVKYDSTTSTITCVFLNQLRTLIKSCSIRYGQCDREVFERASANTTTDTVTLNIEASGRICYNVTARNGSHSVMVHGTIVDATSDSQVTIILSVIVVIVIVLIVLSLIVVLLTITIKKRNAKYKGVEDFSLPEMSFSGDIEHLMLKGIDSNNRRLKEYDVDVTCSVKEFVEKKGLNYKIGCAFYEFTNSVESISEDKELIFRTNSTKKLYTPSISPVELREKGLLGERVQKPSLETHTLFVQSMGSGTRHLLCGDKLLYELEVPHPLWHVDQDQFILDQLDEHSTLVDWCNANKREYTGCCIYLELSFVNKDSKILDAILLDKNTKQLLTGPDALRDVRQHIEGTMMMDSERWRVFVLSNYDNIKTVQLEGKPWILYHELEYLQQEDETVPVVRIKSEQFTTKLLDKDYKLEDFKNEHNLNCCGCNVFGQIGKVDIKNKAMIKDVILMDKKNEKFFTGPSSLSEAEKYKKEKNDKMTDCRWRAFALCQFEPGTVLLKNSWVLYRVKEEPLQRLLPIYSDGITLAEMKCGGEYKMSEFCKGYDETDIFLECGCFEPDICTVADTGKDVILMDKDNKTLFTGPYARQLAEEIRINRDQQLQHWRVFLLSKYNKSLTCVKDTIVLHQSPKGKSQECDVLIVDEDSVRMYQFITKKLELDSIEVGNAFYEFTQNEDLLYYKEIVLLPKRNVENKEAYTTQVKFRSFYKISGVPGMGIKPFSKWGFRIFIQSTSQGARLLKRGDTILYKKKQ